MYVQIIKTHKNLTLQLQNLMDPGPSAFRVDVDRGMVLQKGWIL